MNKAAEFIYLLDSKQRLDNYLAEQLATSRTQIMKLIDLGLCSVNGNIKKPAYKLNFNDIIHIDIPEPKVFDLKAEEIPLDIVYEDDEIIVLNKAFGMVVHPSYGHDTGTLVNALLYHCKNLNVGFHEHRPGIVHRLDKDTGGLMVIAKTQKALADLSEQFKAKSAGRIYNAICFGRPKTLSGTIENYLGRAPGDRKKFTSSSNSKSGKMARTHFKVLHQGPISVFELRLDTGRTHQIRVHLSEYGCPIVNDPIYGSPKRVNGLIDSRLKSLIKSDSTMLLFARRLSFTHPITLKSMSFKVNLPKSFTDLLDYLDVRISDY